MNLEGKTALITGATRGIGRAMAVELASAGCHVIGVGRSREALDSLKGERIDVHRCDVSVEAEVQTLFDALKGKKIDFLINNAGAAHELKNVGELSLKEWQRMLDTNLTSMFMVTSRALKLMGSGGLIINVLSVAARTPFTGFSAYNASKAGALAFTNTLREELREKGFRVCALVPGATETEIWGQFWADAPKDRMVKPESIAKTVAQICALPAGTSVDEIQITPIQGAL